MDPKYPEFDIGMLIDRGPKKILAPLTPGLSHGTKIFGQKIFSYHPVMIIFYPFCEVVLQKVLKNAKKVLFQVFPSYKKEFS